ncbi:MCP four helix bundle domain-containing protein [Pedobacter flavus]|uniref:MCP four helix bundle domain-containing protein n=1 Tax=Pedobacter flavus TaxID=3113906 RepID=A0ABU7H0F3_9SPHI|nr:MCP four helix bundle domain-containing protein [Pedobacter sp. VNH31]MEE1884809.1 MCP four helix bundle domain-containing protein [Pedobacter sp. VNH31]
MKFSFYIQQKLKIAVLLFLVMGCTILIRTLEDKSVNDMNTSFKSLYNDRLIPSVLLHDINLLLTEKNWTLEKYIQGSAEIQPDYISSVIAVNNKKIDSLLLIYDKTYIVETEASQLKNLKTAIKEYKIQENQVITYILNNQRGLANNLYEINAKKTYLKISQNINYLLTTQINVGSELINDVDDIVSGTKLYSAIQIGLAIIIGLLIMGILFAVKSTKTAPQKDFHLN